MAHLGKLDDLPDGNADPITWVALRLLTWIAPLFILLSMNSAVIQGWFSNTQHQKSSDPFFLNMAGNAGSLIALLLYPMFIEPTFSAVAQTWWWSLGYGLFGVLAATCLVVVWRRGTQPLSTVPDAVTTRAISPTREIRLLWVVMALLPSTLLLSNTTYASEQISPMPLLWVIPLILYLLTMILAFSKQGPSFYRWASLALPFFAVPWAVCLLANARTPLLAVLTLHLASFFSSRPCVSLCDG